MFTYLQKYADKTGEHFSQRKYRVLKLHIHTTAFAESIDELGLRKSPAVKAQ